MGGSVFQVSDPRIVPTATVVPLLDQPWSLVVRRLRTASALLVTRA